MKRRCTREKFAQWKNAAGINVDVADEDSTPAVETLKVSHAGEQACCDYQKELDNTRCELTLLREEVKKLREGMKNSEAVGTLTEDALICDDEKVQLYTGLPCYATLMVVFEFVSEGLKPHHRSTLSLFSQFMMTLVKIRLNLRDAYLGYRFGVHQSAVSRLVLKWIDIIYIRLSSLCPAANSQNVPFYSTLGTNFFLLHVLLYYQPLLSQVVVEKNNVPDSF